MTGARPIRNVVAFSVAAALTLSAAVAVSVSALPRAANCTADVTVPARCPSLVQRSPDTPTIQRALVADPARHRVYVVGTDEAGYQAFRAIDTRTRAVVGQANYWTTNFADESAAGVNTVAAKVTPDGRTIVACGYVFHNGNIYAAAIALSTATGRPRWTWVGSRPGGLSSVALDSTGRHAYVAGSEQRLGADDAMIRTFDVASGRSTWVSYLPPDASVDTFFNAVDVVAGRVVAAGTAWPDEGDSDQLVASVDPRTGRWLKVRHLDDGGYEFGLAATVGPDQHSVVITGAHSGPVDTLPATPADAYAPEIYQNDTETVMVDVRDLTIRWRQHQANTGGLATNVATVGNEVLIGYTTTEVYSPYVVANASTYAQGGLAGGLGVQALDGRTGAELWHREDIAPTSMASFELQALAVGPQTAYVVGTASVEDSRAVGTLPLQGFTYDKSVRDGFVAALDVATGKTRWSSDYNDDDNGTDASSFTAAASTADGLFVAGVMDTRTLNALGGTVNGTLLRYAP